MGGVQSTGVNKEISLSLPQLQSIWPLNDGFFQRSLLSFILPVLPPAMPVLTHSLTLPVIWMLMSPEDLSHPIFGSSLSNFLNIRLVIRCLLFSSWSFPLGSFAGGGGVQSFWQGSLLCQSFWLDWAPSAWLGASWGLISGFFHSFFF